MRITYFRLKGYAKILNGMGLDEVVIDFTKMTNRIVLVQGENGTGKSAIISSMTPNPDSTDNFRTDVFIDENGNRQIVEYPAEKEIHYVGFDDCGNEAFYQILIKSIVNESKTNRTTKAFISKNGEELNPNGNISSFKEIRDAVLCIDPTYLDLSSISSENRGIVDMLPSDRRKYMASYIGSLDTYNNIFKIISKKVTALKSYMNTLNAKIFELGDENEMRMKLIQLENDLENKNQCRDQLLKDLAEAEATVKLVDPDNKMQDLYVSISERLENLKSEMSKNSSELLSLSTLIGIDPESTDIQSLINETTDAINSYEKGLSEKKNRISTLISLNESTLQKIDSDRSILDGMETNTIQDNIEKTVADLRSEVDSYKRHLSNSDIEIIKTTSVDELNDLRDALNDFLREVSVAEEMYTDDIFQQAVDASNGYQSKNSLQDTITRLKSNIASNEAKIEALQNKAEKLASDLEKLKEFRAMRPANCTIDNCPYIKNYVSMINNVGSQEDVNKCYTTIEKLQKDNERWSGEIEVASKMCDISNIINGAISIVVAKKSIIKKFKDLKYLCNPDNIKKLIKAHYKFPDFKIATSMIEKALMYQELEKARDQLKSLESDLKIYQNNKALMDKLNDSIARGEAEYSEREAEIKTLNKDCTFVSGVIVELNLKIERLNSLTESMDTKVRLDKEMDDLRNEFAQVRDKIKLVKDKIDSLNNIKNQIINIESSIDPLENAINQIRFDLSNIINYQTEYKETADKYEKMTFIRNACSPGNGLGIQSEYIKRYMNDIIIDCNKMLSFMFNGQIQLDVPVIDEKHFSMPFIGPNGIQVPDVGEGSTGQRCMIGLVFSCVAMMKSSTSYNILRLDEIDGGLDQQNRVTFINVLNNIINFMNAEQCIICSHNAEFDTQTTSKIVCTHSGIKVI